VLQDVKEGNHIEERSLLQRLKLANYPRMHLSTERGRGVCDLSSDRLPSEALHRVEESTVTEPYIQQLPRSRAFHQARREHRSPFDFRL
jgi:hypothetical protein